MSEKMLLSENECAGIAGISLLLIELIFIMGNVLGIVSIFHNSTLTKNPFGIFLLGLPNFILFVTLLFMVWGGWEMCSDNGDGRKFKRGRKMFVNGGIASFFIGTFILLSNVLGIVSIFHNSTLTKNPFGIFLFGLPNFILFVTLLFMVWGGWEMCSDNGDGCKYSKGLKTLKYGMISSFLSGPFILVTDVIFLKVPFGIHLFFSYCFLLLLLFAPQVYRAWSAIPEEDTKARFIAFLENIVPIEFQEEWLGDLREQHHQSIKEGKPPWKVYFITLRRGLGLIRSYLWLKADNLVSRWMTRAKKVFLG